MSQLSFSDLQLGPGIQQAIKDNGYENPTPIQQQAIPIVLQGHDLLAIAQTGTGKTAAFSLPILQSLVAKPVKREPRCVRALVLTPTRELAIQIHKSFQGYGKHLKLKYASIFGGVGQRSQVHALSQGVDVLIATPGRLLDLLSQRFVRLDKIEVFVLDEADRMLDMGFLKDVKKIIPVMNGKRHNLFFSATMPPEIQKLSQTILKNHKTVEVTPPSTTVEKIKQSVMYVNTKEKMNLLIHLLKDQSMKKVLVFVEMKHFANRVVDKLEINSIGASAIHGNKSQGARQKALEDFSKNRIRVLVATDIASRGIDIDGITHVINFELPHIAENYVHRIGRTARAGAAGSAITFCSEVERSFWVEIEKVTNQKVDVVTDQPYHSPDAMNARTVSVGKAKAKIEGQRRKPPQNFRRGTKKRHRT